MSSGLELNTGNLLLTRAHECLRRDEIGEALGILEEASSRYPEISHLIRFTVDYIHRKHLKFNFKRSYDAKIKKVADRPKNWPDWLHLPDLKGVGNDYTFIDELRQEWSKQPGNDYHLGVSVVIPVYNRTHEVDYVLAGLTHQTYPKHLIQVVIADDGSQEDLSGLIKRYQKYLNIDYCRQEDLGYRLAKVRNLGVSHSKYDSIVLLDSDAIPGPELIARYMDYFHVHRGIALFGLRHYVSVNSFTATDYLHDSSLIKSAPRVRSENDVAAKAASDGLSSDWRTEHIVSSDFAKREKLPYRFLVGANCAFTKELFDKVGGYSEDFQAWGFEDQEFGYRLLNHGAYFIPVMDNFVYHQEPLEGKNDTDRKLGASVTKSIFIEKCPFIYRKHVTKKSGFEAPLVSIYVPLYNREKHILECVQSALDQTIKDLDVVVCDDGSTDRSLEILSKYFGRNPRVKIVTKRNGGIGSASNAAVNATRGHYIGQLDADDVLMLDAVELCLKEMEADTDLSLVYGTTEYIDDDSKYISDGWNWPLFTREYLTTKMIVHHFRFFRRRDWSRTSGFNEDIKNAVDFDMMLKLSEVGNVRHINKVMYQYRKHAETTTVKHNSEQTDNTFKVISDSLARSGIKGVVAFPRGDDVDPRAVVFDLAR